MSEIAAYHEAGHVVVATELGGRVVSVTLDPEAPDVGPAREGDVTVEWPQGRSPRADLFVALAGPVAEMIYRDDEADASVLRAWSEDYRFANAALARMAKSQEERAQLFQIAVNEVRRLLDRDDLWTVIGDVADALMAHEELDAEMVADVLQPWGY